MEDLHIVRRRRQVYKDMYPLSRQYGRPAKLVRTLEVIPDVRTGRELHRTVAHDIVLVSAEQTQRTLFDQDITFIKGNSSFIYGALFEAEDRVGFFSGESLPKGFDLKKDDFVVLDGRKYLIFKHEEIDPAAGWMVHLRLTAGLTPYGLIKTGRVETFVALGQDVSTSVNLEPFYDQLNIQQTITASVVRNQTVTSNVSVQQDVAYE